MLQAIISNTAATRQRAQSLLLAALRVKGHRMSSKISGTAGVSPAASDSSVPVTIPVPWGHIAGKAWGQPSGQPVLAVHGWLDNAGSFDNLMPLLSHDLYVVAVDLPGHGQSSHRPKGASYNFVDYISDLKYIVDGLNWKKFSLLGHSMGAGVATWFAAALPDHVTCMVIIEGLGPATYPLDELPHNLGRGLCSINLTPPTERVYPTWDAVVDKLLSGHKFDMLDRPSAEVLARRSTHRVEDGYTFTRDNRLKNPSLLRIPDAVNDAFLKQISCPILAVFAENTFISQALRERRFECIRKSGKAKLSVVTVPGGHHVHLYNPAVMSEHINTFLTSQLGPATP